MSAGVILVDPRGRVLMQLRDDDAAIMFPGCWGITGGAGNPGETPEQIARREVLEETGLALGKIEPFRAYYFHAQPAAGRRATRRSADFELYLFHAPCTTPAEELVCGEGRELRFLGPADLPGIDLAYNHREVLEHFFASPAYAGYLRGVPFQGTPDGDAVDPVEQFVAAIDAGAHWFDALMRTIALWERPQETAGGRGYRYLIAGEAFDWLLLAERLIASAGGRVPAREAERLLFEGIAPAGSDAAGGAPRMTDERLRELLGDTKHRAHLNYLYGVVVEEALQYAVELEVSKERATVNIRDPRMDEMALDPVYERVYGRPRAALLREFRDAEARPHARHIALWELREFMYWLFKYRVKNQDPARVASDTRKALAQLSAMEAAARRPSPRGPQQPEPAEDVLDAVSG